jgi:glyoxylase-like metal-dependent hydrolase (beta-lactamase superfamily II)
MSLFRQLFHPATSSLAYLLADPITRAAALIDPVPDQQYIYRRLFDQLGLKLRYVLATHTPADNHNSLSALCAETGTRLAAHESATIQDCDQRLRDGDRIYLGEEVVDVIHTPAATPCAVTYLWSDRLFTGDSVWPGCASQATALYDSVRDRLFCLPDEYLVYPGHAWQGLRVSCIGQEKQMQASTTLQQRCN